MHSLRWAFVHIPDLSQSEEKERKKTPRLAFRLLEMNLTLDQGSSSNVHSKSAIYIYLNVVTKNIASDEGF